MVFDVKLDDNGIDPHDVGGKYGYRIGHTDGTYTIPDRVLNTVDDRPIKVITIGAGISGILMAYLLQKKCENVDHVIYEKNGDIGGTWIENRYPGCACDVPSHAYTFNFALNAEWPAYLSESDDIFRYLTRVVDCFDLRKYMRFNSIIQECEWNEEEGKWHVAIKDAHSGEIKHDTCDILLGANGLLNAYKFPNEIDGLQSFKGKIIHSARWPDDYTAKQWKNERVAVLGSGASSIQIVPSLQPEVKHLDVFVRTPVWFAELAGHGGENTPYDEQTRRKLKNDTDALLATAKEIEGGLNAGMGIKALMPNSAEAQYAKAHVANRMKEFLTNEDIYQQLLPSFALGCRRLTPGNPFMRAVQKSNVTLHRAAVSKATSTSVIGDDGKDVEVDTIICATGFDVSFVPPFPMRGRNGVLLSEKWKLVPEGYMGLATPDMPNYFMFQGPTFPVANGSVMGALQAVGNYIVKVIYKMQRERIHSIEPKQDVTDVFNAHAQAWHNGSCWGDRRCRSWYKNPETGRVNAVWPGSSLHYIEMVENPRYEDYNVKYENPHNMFAFMGLGFTRNQTMDNGDLSPYLNMDELEQKFYSFKPLADEEERVRTRRFKVNDGPIKVDSRINTENGLNGVHGNVQEAH